MCDLVHILRDMNAELVKYIFHTGDPSECEILKPGTQLCKF